MKKRSFVFLFMAMILAFAGCGKKNSQGAELDTDTNVSESEEAPGGNENTREVVDGKVRSYFTGEWIDEEIGNRRPLAIMLNNKQEALPMSGVNNASVIVECPVEKRITRWMGIFEDWEDMERIGSIRSCRLYFLHFAQEYEAVYAHFGQAVYALDALNSGEYDVLSGGTKYIEHPVSAMYDRVSRPGKDWEHTLYAFPKGIIKDIKKKGYDMNMPSDYSGKFQFAPIDEIEAYEDYPDAVFLQPGGVRGEGGFGGVKATFEYNEKDHKYYRSTYGNPHIDELTGDQVAVTNVIFQYCDGNVLDDADYLHFASQAEHNDCIVFTNGKMIEGYWNAVGELGVPARYYTEDGKEIVLNNGKTFICIIWNDYADDVVIQ